MSLIEATIQGFRYLNKHKSKVFVFILSVFVFTFLLFPFNELSELASSQVSKLTNNQVYLQFQEMDISLAPTPTLVFNQVYVENQMTPPLSLSELKITPSLMGLIQKKPYGQIETEGLFSGKINIAVGSGGKSETSQEEKVQLKINASELSLKDLKKTLNINFDFGGTADFDATLESDLKIVEQPDGEFTLHVAKLDIPTNNINTPMGLVTLPNIFLTDVTLKGKLGEGQLTIEDAKLGTPKDELFGKVSGKLGLSLTPNLTPIWSNYSLDVRLTTTPQFQSKASLYLTLLDGYKKPSTGPNSEYAFKISAISFMDSPDIKAIK